MSFESQQLERRQGCSVIVKWLLLTPFFLLMLCACSMCTILLGHELYGTAIEALVRYSNSKPIWSGHGVYGSGDWGTKVYIRWTGDDTESVRAYYAQLPEAWRAQVYEVSELDFRKLVVCRWVGFSDYDRVEKTYRYTGCNTVRNDTPSYGTLIVFSHDYFAG
jgi:hypothetical protein